MSVVVKFLGILFTYPLGPTGPARQMAQYFVEAEDGRLGIYEEWDEEPLPSGTYNFSQEVVDSIFNKEVELAEDEW